MANGYVNPYMRMRMQPFPQPQRPPSNDPAALFAQPQVAAEQGQCMFPSAFPEYGPNIIQRFWIRLFWFFASPVVVAYRHLRQTYSILQNIREIDVDMLTLTLVENSWSLLIGLLVILVLSAIAWFFSPKGENNTIWRSTLILSFASCYIMWAITFLAQWHPLIAPKVAHLRPGYAGMS